MNNIALLGFGTVGKGVFELLKDRRDVSITRVLDLPTKKEELGSLYSTKEEILQDENISTIIECMGGDTLAYEIIKEGLTRGKNVITSNKETVSLHLEEYLSLAQEHHCCFRFEASVGGGIPLLDPAYQISCFDQVDKIEGILNGTTNFILSKMQKENLSFQESLKLAQEKGFAERDPSADLQGLDMVRKGVILSSLCYHKEIHNEDVIHFGIEHIDLDIIHDIQKRGKVLRFLMLSSYQEKLSLQVIPALLSPSHPLSQIQEEYNGVTLYCKNNSLVTLSGKGAGRYPTASAILQDLNHILEGAAPFRREKVSLLKNEVDLSGDYYVYDGKESKILSSPSFNTLSSYPFVAKIL